MSAVELGTIAVEESAVGEALMLELEPESPEASFPVDRSLYVAPAGVAALQIPEVAAELALKPAPYSTSGPGSGKTGSTASTVAQPFWSGRLAFHMYGKSSNELKVSVRRSFAEVVPATISTHAQFM